MRLMFSCRQIVAPVAGALALLATGPAAASLLWDWSYTGVGISAAGTFFTSNSPIDGNGNYQIFSITGIRNGEVITGLQANGTSIPGNSGFNVDNHVKLTPGQLSHWGFGFSLANGSYSNPYYADFLSTPIYYEVLTDGTSFISEIPITFEAHLRGVPEPASVALLLTGLGLLRGRKARRGQGA